MKRVAFAAALATCQPVVASAGEEDLEIHRSEEFTSPGVEPDEVLHFVRVITVNWQDWDKQPRANPRAKPPLPLEKALDLAEASLDPSETAGSDNLHVTKVELCSKPSLDPDHPATTIAFYVVNFRVNDNDVPRAVLMDGTVLKPKLTRIPEGSGRKR